MVQGYTVQYCFIENLQKIQICDNDSISATILESTVNNLKPNTTYYFQVRVHTKLGAGPYTKLINVSTTNENPIPQLLIVSNGNVQLWDLDLQVKVKNQVQENYFIEDIAYSVAEHKIYWIENKHPLKDRYNLMTWEMNKNNITKISLKNYSLNLCIDWVARNLYWTEFDESGNNNLMKLDLTMWQNGKYDKILKMKYNPTALTIQPLMGFLYWMEYQPDNQYAIMKSDLDGKNVQLFLKKFNMNFSPLSTATFIDTTNTEEPRCNLILSFEGYNQYFHLLTVDMTNVYLSAQDTYILKKKYALLDNEENAFKHVQIVRNTSIDYMKAFVNITANSIVLNFPEPIPKRGCKKYNLPTTIYTIYLSMAPLFGSDVILITNPDKLNAPENVTVQALTPTIAA
ncbi:proto-oncogene tyrosine-protein kinase ros, partial [Lasius niger]